MKKLLLIALLALSANTFAQWRSYTDLDPFDGATKTVVAKGYGGEFPYKNPSIVFRKRGDKVEVYVTGAGSLACKNALITFSNGNPHDTIDFYLNPSQSGDAGFFKKDFLSLYDLITRLKKGSMMYVKFETRCSNKRFKLSLKGSSAALSLIFGSKYTAHMQELRAKRDANIKLREEEEATRVAANVIIDAENKAEMAKWNLDMYDIAQINQAIKMWSNPRLEILEHGNGETLTINLWINEATLIQSFDISKPRNKE